MYADACGIRELGKYPCVYDARFAGYATTGICLPFRFRRPRSVGNDGFYDPHPMAWLADTDRGEGLSARSVGNDGFYDWCHVSGMGL